MRRDYRLAAVRSGAARGPASGDLRSEVDEDGTYRLATSRPSAGVRDTSGSPVESAVLRPEAESACDNRLAAARVKARGQVLNNLRQESGEDGSYRLAQVQPARARLPSDRGPAFNRTRTGTDADGTHRLVDLQPARSEREDAAPTHRRVHCSDAVQRLASTPFVAQGNGTWTLPDDVLHGVGACITLQPPGGFSLHGSPGRLGRQYDRMTKRGWSKPTPPRLGVQGVEDRIPLPALKWFDFPNRCVGVTVTPDGNLGCTGVMVGPRHFVTAAHCVEGVGAHQFKIMLGPWPFAGFPALGTPPPSFKSANIDCNSMNPYLTPCDGVLHEIDMICLAPGYQSATGVSKMARDFAVIVLKTQPLMTGPLALLGQESEGLGWVGVNTESANLAAQDCHCLSRTTPAMCTGSGNSLVPGVITTQPAKLVYDEEYEWGTDTTSWGIDVDIDPGSSGSPVLSPTGVDGAFPHLNLVVTNGWPDCADFPINASPWPWEWGSCNFGVGGDGLRAFVWKVRKSFP